jgi:sugar/nucleoside kinase (ribokinase family)
VPAPPAKAFADRMTPVADGMAISVAWVFARLGGKAAAWAGVGDDADGEFIRESLAAEGLDVSVIRTVQGGRSSQVAVIVDAAGRTCSPLGPR